MTQEYYQSTIESEIGENQMLQLTLIMRNKDSAKSYQGREIISKTRCKYKNGAALYLVCIPKPYIGKKITFSKTFVTFNIMVQYGK